ncbi:MAG: reverse transcriptase family protein [Candidatus Thiodiazotropha sp.]
MDFIQYWQDKLSAPPIFDSRPVTVKTPPIHDLDNVIVKEEVRSALTEMKGTACGLDRIKPEKLLHHLNALTAYLNILLYCGFIPNHLNTARVTFVEKSDDPTTPSDYRPISISSAIVRCLNKVISKRWSNHLVDFNNQFAFLKCDGCFQATSVLNAVLRGANRDHIPFSMSCIDLSKAFDSVSQDTILRCAESYGATSIVLDLIKSSYQNNVSILPDGTSIHPQRGVRQGDPLSPFLFLFVMDEILSCDKFISLMMDNTELNYIAYADDLLLFAPNIDYLTYKTKTITAAAQLSGLELNSSKSFVLNVVSNKKRKVNAVKEESLTFDGKTLNSIGPCDTFKFLGINFSARGKASANVYDLASNMLREISAAPLKPQQRLSILRKNLIPKLKYSLCLGLTHRKTLKSLDITIRKFVRQWLRLPTDTPTAYFHTSIRSGGLGIPDLVSSVSLERRRRSDSLLSSPNPICRWAGSKTIDTNRFSTLPISIAGVSVNSKEEVKWAWKHSLVSSVDGACLAHADDDPANSQWLNDGCKTFGGVFLRCCQLRCALLSTKARLSRRDSSKADTSCRGLCGKTETLSHILQTCAITHDARCRRHNDVCTKLWRSLQGRGIKVLYEPRIPVGNTFCKPDLVILSGDNVNILEVSICNPLTMANAWEIKRQRYDNDETNVAIRSFLLNVGESCKRISHTPIIISANGLLYQKSARILKKLGLTLFDMSDLNVCAMMGSLRTYDCYMRGTYISTDY